MIRDVERAWTGHKALQDALFIETGQLKLAVHIGGDDKGTQR